MQLLLWQLFTWLVTQLCDNIWTILNSKIAVTFRIKTEGYGFFFVFFMSPHIKTVLLIVLMNEFVIGYDY